MRGWMALAGGGLMLAACQGKPEDVTAEAAWVRLPAVAHRPGAAYLTIHGGPAAETLISIACDVAIRSEMHETMRAGGVADMKPLSSVAIPAGATVTFAPGSRHVMLFDINPALKPGGAHTPLLTLTFADGKRVTIKAPAVGAGDPAPAS